MKNLGKFGTSLAILLFVSACGGGGDSNTGTTTTTGKSALKPIANNAELESLIKQQMLETYGSVRSEVYLSYPDANETNIPNGVADNDSASFSSTNTQEAGVDEADRIKTDGSYLYTLSTTDYPYNYATMNQASESSASALRIFKTNQASTTLSSETPLDSDASIRATGLYLNGQTLAVLADTGQVFGIWDSWFTPSYWMNHQNQVYLLNITNPANPIQTSKLTLDGQIISSRQIGSTLYLATRYTPVLSNLTPYPATEAEAAANRERINQASLTDFLPTYQLNSGSKTAIFSGDDCFINQYNNKQNSQSSIISLLAIDLNDTAPTPQGKCFVGDTETLYASTEAIYLATTQYNYSLAETTDSDSTGTSDKTVDIAVYDPEITTDLHKFSLASGSIDYRGSGRINGHLGWKQTQKPFRMSEYNDVLRVITYTGSWSDRTDSPASLYTLQENTTTQTLDTLAKLPNSTHPEPLGKAGEQIYATRFLGDKGYLVTFRVTDPLYILDLSNPADPFIAGELKTDGYSDYLHPVGEHYLLGIGKDAIPDTGSISGDESRGAWYQGVKLSLIDISNPANPYEKSNIIIGKRGTETAVSISHHALTTLQQGSELHVALPISLHDGTANDASAPSTHYNWNQDELFRLTINSQTGTMQTLSPIISEVNENTASGTYNYSYLWPQDRSVIIGNNIHYLHGNKVISQTW